MLLATVCLSNSTILSKFVLQEKVGPFTILALRFVLASLMLWVFYLAAPGWKIYLRLQSRRHFWSCVAVALTHSLSQILFYLALVDLDPGLAQMIFSLNPVIVAMIMLLFGESLTRLKIVRLVLGIAGLYFLTLAGTANSKPLNLVAVTLVIGAAVVYGIHFVVYQKLLPNTNSRTNTLYILSVMAVLYSFLELPIDGLKGVAAVSPLAWFYILLMALVATALGRLFMFAGLALIGGTQVAMIGIAEPLIVLLSSIIFLNERLNPPQWLGAGLVVLSIALAGLVKSQSRPEKFPVDLAESS